MKKPKTTAEELYKIIKENDDIGLEEAHKQKLIPVNSKTASITLRAGGYKYEGKKWLKIEAENPDKPDSNNLKQQKELDDKEIAHYLFDRTRGNSLKDKAKVEFKINCNTTKEFYSLAAHYNLVDSDLAEIAIQDFINKYGIKND